MRIDLTVRNRHGLCRDVAITAPEGSAVRDVHVGLTSVARAEPAAELWAGPRRLAPDAPLGGLGLRTGDVVSVGAPGPADPAAGAVLRLQVVGGPDAGQVVALPRGIVTIGRGVDCDLVLTDPDVSRRHASVTVTSVGTIVRDLMSTNGTSIDGHPVDDDGTPLTPDAILRVGDSFVAMCAGSAAPAAVHATAGGALLVNRPPRVQAALGRREVQFPVRGSGSPPQRVQWIAAAVPALAGVGLALAFHSPQFLIFALMSPVVIVATSLGDRLHWRRSRRRDATGLRQRETRARADVAAGLAHETVVRRRAGPDPAALYDVVAAPGVRLWERPRRDANALSVRLGLTDLPSALQARRGSDVTAAGRVIDVPSSVDLRAGPLGVAAPPEIGLGVARWLICQLAVLHSPADVEIALLLSDDAASSWAWARWLPHLSRVATTSDERQSLVADVGSLVEERLAVRRLDPEGWDGRWLVLVVDRARALIDLSGLSALLAAGRAAGITAICLDEHERQLPASCAACAVAAGEMGARLRMVGGASGRTDLVADRVTEAWADRVARGLAPLADAGREAGTALPHECRLVDVLGIDDFDVAQLLARWGQDDGSASTVLGMGVDGPVHVDLVRDGPHALVAGTTGSGKSELLQSLVAGLALCHPPEAISFVLIDYKGGAAFADCARLPHTVGLVTDLDAQLTARALRSLHAELARRERLFAQVGAKDLAAYRAVTPQPEQLGRLVLVVDEFAALADELPDFVNGLVAIAQRGRSLGVHLVLATQRPGGVVSPEIRANATLRIALRVSDPAESADVIGTDRAAQLGRDTPGRAIVCVGPARAEVQTARVGGPSGTRANHEVSITPLGSWLRPVIDPAGAGPDGKTDLHLLVDTVREAAHASGRREVRRPWLPPLPARLPIRELARGSASASVTFGLLDDPKRQLQSPLSLDLEAGSSVLFTGGPRSGRSTALVTIAAAAAGQLAPDELAIYVLDCAGGALGVLAELPHCGTAVTREPFELVEKLLGRLETEVIRRQAWLVERGVGSVAEARVAGLSIPLMLCLLDGWESFAAAAEEHDGGHSVEALGGLLRTAAAAGLTVVLAGDRSTLAARLGGAVATKFVLGLAERADYALAGISARAVPLDMPPGRAIRAADATEVQIAFVGGDPTRAEQARSIRAVAARVHRDTADEPADGVGPIRLKPLPGRITLDALPVTPGRFTLGAGGDAAQAVSVDLFAGAARLLVAGPPRSGRSSTLRTLLVQAVRAGVAVVVAAPRRSPLVGAAEAHGIVVVAPDAEARAARLAGQHRTLLLVDDSEAFLDTQVGDAITASVRAAPAALAAVVAGDSDDLPLTYRGVAAEVRRSRCALVLQPGPGDGDLIGRRLPRRRRRAPAGRGVLIGDGAWGAEFSEPVPIQVALP
ncbi:MAG: segregation ATPase FtsK/SpoIIIE -like protein [Pseudonocardiales bacterium]|nr:segregation ATPase FtsK/SpoIIIE -like protein [Pseudonocardiales bacterium]